MFFPLSRGWDSGGQAWWHAPLPNEPSQALSVSRKLAYEDKTMIPLALGFSVLVLLFSVHIYAWCLHSFYIVFTCFHYMHILFMLVTESGI